MWSLVTVDAFDRWFLSLNDAEQESMLVGLLKLQSIGPQLGRPDVDSLKASTKVKNLKELRIQHRGKPYASFLHSTPLGRPSCCVAAIKPVTSAFMNR